MPTWWLQYSYLNVASWKLSLQWLYFSQCKMYWTNGLQFQKVQMKDTGFPMII